MNNKIPTALVANIEFHVCIKCGHDKPETEYGLTSSDKRKNDCKSCVNKYLSEYYEANKEAMKKKSIENSKFKRELEKNKAKRNGKSK